MNPALAAIRNYTKRIVIARNELWMTHGSADHRWAGHRRRRSVSLQHGKSSSLRTIISESHNAAFVIEDQTGRAIVDPTSARTSLEIDSQSTVSSLATLPRP